MKKYKFTILKYTLNNGSVYYMCKVKILHTLVWTVEGIGLFLNNYKDNEKYLTNMGNAFWSIDSTNRIKTREAVLEAINLYMSKQEKEDGEEIASIETEIIWR